MTRMMRAILASILLASMLSACVGPPKGHKQDKARPMVKAEGKELRQCLSDLDKVKARYALLPNQDFGAGCSQSGNVQLLDAGIPITNVKAVRCDVARTLSHWLREDVQPAAKEMFGARVVRVESMGGYSCRNVIGRAQAAGNRSEHATGNAIDIGGFTLSNGRRVSVLGGWNGTPDEREFLRAVRSRACKRFKTVLSPDYNAAHHNHFHLDMGRGPYCR